MMDPFLITVSHINTYNIELMVFIQLFNSTDFIYEPWSWYAAGPLIAMIMFALLFTGKQFGLSSPLRTVCAAAGAGKAVSFFKFDWRAERWNLIVIAGAIVGGFIASHYLSNNKVQINDAVTNKLAQELNITSTNTAYLPTELFGTENLADPTNILILLLGGVLVGFGARYAGGCTSGHAISGLSNLQLPSFIAVIGFFIGGLLMNHFLLPLIF